MYGTRRSASIAAFTTLFIIGASLFGLPPVASASSTVMFNFDSGSPTLILRQGTPFDQSSGSVTAHFSSPQDPASFSVQSQGTTSYVLSQLSGNYLESTGGSRHTLLIKFDTLIKNITLSFATIDYHDPGVGGTATPIMITAYVDSTSSTPVGTSSAHGIFTTDTYPQGTISFASTGSGFNLVSAEVQYLAQGAVDFIVDNVVVTTADQAADTTPPVTTASLIGISGTQGWYTSSVSVSLAATDASSTVTKTEYSFDNAAWVTYTAPFDVTSEGSTNIYYRSMDSASNLEKVAKQTIKIDKTAPTGTIKINNGDATTASTTVQLALTQQDATSGVYRVRYSNDGVWDTEQWESPAPTKAWTLASGDGAKTVYYQVVDNAGLTSQTASDSITLQADTTKPVAVAGQDQSVKVGDTTSFNAGASTDNVGITSYSWSFGDGGTGTGVTATHSYSAAGTYTVTLIVKDAAGNSADSTLKVTVAAAASGIGAPPWLAFLIVVAGLGISLALMRRSRKPE